MTPFIQVHTVLHQYSSSRDGHFNICSFWCWCCYKRTFKLFRPSALLAIIVAKIATVFRNPRWRLPTSWKSNTCSWTAITSNEFLVDNLQLKIQLLKGYLDVKGRLSLLSWTKRFSLQIGTVWKGPNFSCLLTGDPPKVNKKAKYLV